MARPSLIETCKKLCEWPLSFPSQVITEASPLEKEVVLNGAQALFSVTKTHSCHGWKRIGGGSAESQANAEKQAEKGN